MGSIKDFPAHLSLGELFPAIPTSLTEWGPRVHENESVSAPDSNSQTTVVQSVDGEQSGLK